MRYTFGHCRLDTASRELSLKGHEVHLSPKAYELLCRLIDHRPRVLPKAELMSALWPETFVVEANLPVLVGELRSALGDHSATASAIKTHHGVGYSFVADVRESRSAADTASLAAVRWLLKVDARRLALGHGANTVGRDADCDVYLNDASVSRSHARVTIHSDSVLIEDLGSKNGTKVNGHPVATPTRVGDGDEIEFGTVKATLISAALQSLSTLTL